MSVPTSSPEPASAYISASGGAQRGRRSDCSELALACLAPVQMVLRNAVRANTGNRHEQREKSRGSCPGTPSVLALVVRAQLPCGPSASPRSLGLRVKAEQVRQRLTSQVWGPQVGAGHRCCSVGWCGFCPVSR